MARESTEKKYFGKGPKFAFYRSVSVTKIARAQFGRSSRFLLVAPCCVRVHLYHCLFLLVNLLLLRTFRVLHSDIRHVKYNLCCDCDFVYIYSHHAHI